MSVKWVPSFLLPLFLIGCSVSPYQYGKQALEMGDYQRAIPSLQDAVRAVPENPHTWRELGIAYYRLGEYAEAIANLERAYRMNPVNAKAVLYLGMTYERNAQYKQALQTYDHLAQITRSATLRGLVALHQLNLKESWYQQRVSEILSQGSDMTMTGTSHQTIAVMPFAGLYENEGVTELAGVLTYLVSELLRESPDLTVTELPLIDRLLDALELEKTDPVDITLGTQIGSLFSAGAVVTGTLKSIEADRLQLDITMMQIHRGEIYEFEPIVGTAVDLAASMRSLLDWMLSIFTSSPEATEMPMAEPEALLDFAKGRKFFDAGEYDKAAETFHRSLQRQPDFEQAKLSFHMVEKFVMAGAKMVGLDALEAELLREDMAVVSRQILLQQIDTKLGHGFMAVSEPQQVRGSGNQQFPGTDRSLTISVQWK